MENRGNNNEQQLFPALAESSSTNVPRTIDGRSQSSAACGSLDTRDPEHGSGMANSPLPSKCYVGSASIETRSAGANVGRLCETGSRKQQKCSKPTRTGDLAAMGESSRKKTDKKGDDAYSLLNPQELRPSELTRLLNSTYLGPVIDERQLYRHRMRAGFQIGDGRRIDLFRYVAWLFEQRQKQRTKNTAPTVCIGTVSVTSVIALLKNQEYRCALTGGELVPSSAALDHITPISRGGAHKIENAQVLLKDVNRAKGTLTNEEFISLCRQVVKWADRTVDA
jgi:hypothetical protein